MLHRAYGHGLEVLYPRLDILGSQESAIWLVIRNDWALLSRRSYNCLIDTRAHDKVQEESQSQRVLEIRPRVAQQLHLFLILPLRPIIPLASLPPRIFLLQQEVHQHAPPEQKHRQISQHNTMALSVEGYVSRLVNVRGDDAVEVAPADDEAHCNAAFVVAFSVVGRPDNGVGDTGVDA